jgi:hypothetical protein
LTVTGNATISGDLTVSGTTTYINTTTLNVGDNIITLNADIGASTTPTENAGIEVKRGNAATKAFYWEEANDRWYAEDGLYVAGNVVLSGTIDTGIGATEVYLMNQNVRTSDSVTFANITGPLTGTATRANHLNTTRDTPDNSLQYWQASGLGITEAPSGDWHNTIRMSHGSPLTYYSNTLAIRMTGSGLGDIYTQTIANGVRQGWKKHWNDGNDGAGSGLDADLWDGYQFSDYLNQAVRTTDSVTFSTVRGTNFRASNAYYLGENNFYFNLTNGGWYSNVRVASEVDMRAPIFYDSDNTAFFINGASNSNLNTLQAYSYQGNSNVAGTGNASYHPSGIYSTGTNWLYGTMYLNANSINDAGDIRLYNSSYHFRARYTAGSDIYHASLNWYGLQLGNNGANYIVAGRTNPNGWLDIYVNNTSDFTSINGQHAARFDSNRIVYIYNQLRTPFIYDLDNTAYYLDPASTTFINDLELAGTFEMGSFGIRNFTLGFNNASNQKANLEFDPGFWGWLEVEATCDYNYANRPGRVAKRYYLGLNPGNAQYANESRIVDVGGPTRYGIAFGDVVWTGSRYRIVIANRDNAANTYYIKVTVFTAGTGGRNLVTNTMTLSSVYTSDGTSYPDSYIYFNDNIGFGTSQPGYGVHINRNQNQVAGFQSPNANTWIDIISTTRNWSLGSTSGATFAVYDRGSNVTRMEVDTGSNLYAYGSMRSPIFYDQDNTGYYTNPAGYSNLNEGNFAGRVWYSNYLVSRNSGGLMGDYNVTGTASKVIWTIGESWPIGNMYGLGYEYGSGYDHHLALRNNGTTYSRIGFAGGAFIGGTVSIGGAMYAPIYYDSNDAGYYGDFASTSRTNYIVGNRIKLVNNVNNEPRWDFSAYVVEAQHWYGNNSSMTMYMGEGNAVQTYNLRSDIYYDRDNTGYYINAASRSRLGRLLIDSAENGWSLMVGPETLSTNGATSIYPDDSRYGLVVNGPYYPHLYINTYSHNSNTTHGGVFSMTGSIPGGFRRFGIGVANWNPNEMSFGWFDNNYNPHYGVGINWSYPASVWFDISHNWYVRNSVYAYTFYDRDNTGYYVNPASGTNLLTLTINDWYYINGALGMYWNSYGRGYVIAEQQGNPYGHITTYGGGRNGWSGYGVSSRYTLMSTTGDNFGLHDSARGWIWYMTGAELNLYYAGADRMSMRSHGVYAHADVRASIYYDHDTGYYFDGNSYTNWNWVTERSKDRIGMTYFYNNPRSNITSDTRYWIGSMGWGTTDFNDVFGWGSGFFDTWSSPGNSPGDTSHWVGIQAAHFNGGYNGYRYGWQMAGGVTDSLWWRHSWAAFGGWFKIAMYGNNHEANRDFYAGFYYDSGDTSYYINPQSTSQFYRLEVNEYLYARNGCGRIYLPGNLHIDSFCGNSIYLNYYSNQWIRHFYHNEHNGYDIYGVGRIDSTIFYDRNNTGYYVDPNGSSQFAAVFANDWFRPQGCCGLYFQSYGRGIWSPECEGNPYGHVTTYGGGRNGWYGWGAGSRYTLMSTLGDNFGLHDSARGWIWYMSGAVLNLYYAGSDRMSMQPYGVYVNNDIRSPIFYDHDTGYYVDGNTWSRLWGLGTFYLRNNYDVSVDHPFGISFSTDVGCGPAYAFYRECGGWGYPYPDVRIAFHTGIKFGANAGYEGMRFYDDYGFGTIRWQFNGGSGYSYQHTWNQLTGYHGHYSGLNSAHIYPNNASYGSWRIDGTRNGWAGIEFNANGAGNVSLMMNSSATGMHNNSYGWHFLRGEGTGYIFKDYWGGGSQATILDSSNQGNAWALNQNVATYTEPRFRSNYFYHGSTSRYTGVSLYGGYTMGVWEARSDFEGLSGGESGGIGINGDFMQFWATGDLFQSFMFSDEDGGQGTYIAYLGSNGVFYNSDRRIKYSIREKVSENYEYIDRFMQLKPVSFAYKFELKDTDTPKQRARKISKMLTVHQGLIAQDVMEVFPDAIHRGSDTRPMQFELSESTEPTLQTVGIDGISEVEQVKQKYIDKHAAMDVPDTLSLNWNVINTYQILALQDFKKMYDAKCEEIEELKSELALIKQHLGLS